MSRIAADSQHRERIDYIPHWIDFVVFDGEASRRSDLRKPVHFIRVLNNRESEKTARRREPRYFPVNDVPAECIFSTRLSSNHSDNSHDEVVEEQATHGKQLYRWEPNGASDPRLFNSTQSEKRLWPKTSHGNDGVWKAWKAKKPAFHLPTRLGNPCGDSHISTATATTIKYLKTGKARRKPAIRATLTARGL